MRREGRGRCARSPARSPTARTAERSGSRGETAKSRSQPSASGVGQSDDRRADRRDTIFRRPSDRLDITRIEAQQCQVGVDVDPQHTGLLHAVVEKVTVAFSGLTLWALVRTSSSSKTTPEPIPQWPPSPTTDLPAEPATALHRVPDLGQNHR